MRFVPGGSRDSDGSQKKADVAEYLQVFDHVGLLINEPSSLAEVPFI
jgi:hypothetical protein